VFAQAEHVLRDVELFGIEAGGGISEVGQPIVE
jgi:hypothetical protein